MPYYLWKQLGFTISFVHCFLCYKEVLSDIKKYTLPLVISIY